MATTPVAPVAPVAADIEKKITESRKDKQTILEQAHQERQQIVEARKIELSSQIQNLNTQLQDTKLRDPKLQAQYQHKRTELSQQLQKLQERNELLANSQHLFKVINGQIKTLIINLQNAVENRENLNQVVKNTVETLETMGNDVASFATMNVQTTDMLARGRQVRADIQIQNVTDFINVDDKDTDANGILSALGKNINLDTLNTNQSTNPTRLETEYAYEDPANPTTTEQIQNRLNNCQYLEILYLTKHDELKKIFAFALSLYDKYTYAIKILLFVLKNLLEQRPCDPPGERTEQTRDTEQATQIRLPQALISNIKQLLKDQKHVQNVITKLKPVVDRTVPNLVNESFANAVSQPFVGSTIDIHNPS